MKKNKKLQLGMVVALCSCISTSINASPVLGYHPNAIDVENASTIKKSSLKKKDNKNLSIVVNDNFSIIPSASLTFFGTHVNQKDGNKTNDLPVFMHAGNMSLNFKHTQNSLVYGAVLSLKTNVSSNMSSSTFVYLDSKDYGRLELGSNSSASDQLYISGDSLAPTSSKIFYLYKQYPLNTTFITSHSSMLESSVQSYLGEKSRKITYFSPEMSGIKLGISYIPDVKNSGTTDHPVKKQEEYSAYNTRTINPTNAFSGGVKYANGIGDIKFKISGIAEYCSKTNSSQDENEKPYENYFSWGLGAGLNLSDMEISAGFTNWGKSFTDTKRIDNNSSQLYTLGVRKFINKTMSVSGIYGHSSTLGNSMNRIIVGADTQLAPYLFLSASGTYYSYEAKQNDLANKNEKDNKYDNFMFMLSISLKM